MLESRSIRLKDFHSELFQIENIDKDIAEQILSGVLDKFKLALETLEKLECLPLKQRLMDCVDYVGEMGQATEIEHYQNIKVWKEWTDNILLQLHSMV